MIRREIDFINVNACGVFEDGSRWMEEDSKETSGYREVLITEISDFYKITNLMKEKDWTSLIVGI